MKQTRKIAEILEVEEIYDIIEQGTTMPVRGRLNSGMNVVIKYMQNPYGQHVLVNEWIGSNIADFIGLTIPEYGICFFSESVIEHTNYNEEIDKRNAGFAFYTKAYSKTIPVIPTGILSEVSNHEIEKLILFDYIVNNNDRHVGNLLCDISRGATLYIIDNSHIITEEPKRPFVWEEAISDDYIVSALVLKNNQDIYDLLCSVIGYSEEGLRQCAYELKAQLTDEILEEIKSNIPNIWIESIGNEKIEQLFKVVSKRISLLDEIAEMIIEERRKV